MVCEMTRVWKIRVSLLAVLAVAVAAVGAFGGFRAHAANPTTVAPGEEFDAGNLVFSLDSATASVYRSDDSTTWTISLIGVARNQQSAPVEPLDYFGDNFLVRVTDTDGQVVDVEALSAQVMDIENPEDYSPRYFVPPTDTPVPVKVIFTVRSDLELGSTATVVVRETVLADTWILGVQHTMRWVLLGAGDTWRVDVPLAVDPEP
jgi:hypothetical protein